MRSFLCLATVFLLAAQKPLAQVTGPAAVSAYIPKGFVLLDSAQGDLNRDAYPDMVLILKNEKEQVNPDAARPLLLLAGTPDRKYRLLARNDNVVLCAGCGGIFGDPLQGITIKNGYFSIEHYGGSNWRWTRIITFRYDPKTAQFLLHKDAGVSFHTSDPDKQETLVNNKADFGRLLFSQFKNSKGM